MVFETRLILGVCTAIIIGALYILVQVNQPLDNITTNKYNNGSDTPWKLKRMCTHEERRNYVKKMCDKWIKKKQLPLPVGAYKLYMDDKRPLIYCTVSKAGGTTWKSLWENANYNHSDRLPNPNKTNVHGKNVKLAGINRLAMKDFDKYPEHTKFVVVRNPFDRVVSAYNNIMSKFGINGKHMPGPGGSTISMLKKYINAPDGTLYNLTFVQFLTFITDGKSSVPTKNRLDRHWSSIAEKCHFCYKNYDIISRIETVSYDTGTVLKIMGYPEDILYSNDFSVHSLRKKSTNDKELGTKELSEYRNVPDELLDKFIEIYKYDLSIFGYGFNRKTFTTECNIQLDSGESCC